MRAPEFWGPGKGRFAAFLLGPAGIAYGWGARLHGALGMPARAPVPVVCVGNFIAGGAGKTPAALAIARLLAARGARPAFLSRGYGGKLTGPVAVTPGRHMAGDVGDEPLLLARTAPTVVSANRRAGAALAHSLGADVIVMDDGLQNRALAKDAALAVVDAGYGFGNGQVMPAGPLRAPLAMQAKLAGGVIVVGAGDQEGVARALAAHHGLALFTARIVVDEDAADLGGTRAVAFSGIARPEKFHRTLREAGISLAAKRAFADHHAFSEADARALLALAARENAALVTTQKDIVRLDGHTGARGALREAARALGVHMAFDDPAGLTAFITARIQRA